MEPNELLHQELTAGILKVFYEVYNELGYGFLERIYQNSLYYELKLQGFEVEAQRKIVVCYKDVVVGDYYADLIVNDSVILELKAKDTLTKDHNNQLINYLKSTEYEVGLLLNFGKKPEFIRRIFQNARN